MTEYKSHDFFFLYYINNMRVNFMLIMVIMLIYIPQWWQNLGSLTVQITHLAPKTTPPKPAHAVSMYRQCLVSRLLWTNMRLSIDTLQQIWTFSFQLQSFRDTLLPHRSCISTQWSLGSFGFYSLSFLPMDLLGFSYFVCVLKKMSTVFSLV